MKTECEICGKAMSGRAGKRFCSVTCRVKAFHYRRASELIPTCTTCKKVIKSGEMAVYLKADGKTWFCMECAKKKNSDGFSLI